MNISTIFLVLFSTSNYAAADMNMLRGILPHLKSSGGEEEVNPNFRCNEGYCKPNLPSHLIHGICGGEGSTCPSCDAHCCPCNGVPPPAPVDEESKKEVLNHAVFARDYTTECNSPSCDPDSDNWCTGGGGQCIRTASSSGDCEAASGCGCCVNESKEVLNVDEDVEEYIEEVNPSFHCHEGYCVPNPNLPVKFLHDACGSDATECPQCDNTSCCPCPSLA